MKMSLDELRPFVGNHKPDEAINDATRRIFTARKSTLLSDMCLGFSQSAQETSKVNH